MRQQSGSEMRVVRRKLVFEKSTDHSSEPCSDPGPEPCLVLEVRIGEAAIATLQAARLVVVVIRFALRWPIVQRNWQ